LMREKSYRNKHNEYEDWLDDHQKKIKKCELPTRIIRIDINEIDQIEDSNIRNIHYLDELFKENNINKFYSFERNKSSARSIYLATNAALSLSSLNSEMSDNTYEAKKLKALKKKRKRQLKQQRRKQQHEQYEQQQKQQHQKHHSHHHKKQQIKKKNLIRTATLNMISKAKLMKSRKQHSDLTVDFEVEYDADLRSYNQKKNEINDNELNLFMASGKCCRRRDAICHKIDTIYGNAELHVFMENLLRQEYIENFLL
jgi:hypothetical protein